MNKRINTLIISSAAALLLSIVTPALAIKKCQDETGKWHYGDVAVTACSNTKVTTLTDRGFVKSELEAPKTKEELEAEEAMLAKVKAEQERQREIEAERARVLSIYETEEDIDRQRDNQINSVQGNIDVHKAYLVSLDKRIARKESDLSGIKNKHAIEKVTKEIEGAKIRKTEYTKNLAKLEAQKEEIMDRFAREKKVYLDLKGESETGSEKLSQTETTN